MMLLEEHKPPAPFTTFGIGGPARGFVEATSEAEIAEAAA
jgi:UDP-N-acetylmuramate dehydrogenase